MNEALLQNALRLLSEAKCGYCENGIMQSPSDQFGESEEVVECTWCKDRVELLDKV